MGIKWDGGDIIDKFFSDQQWNKYNTWIIYQNRLRHDHYKKMFIETGFEIIEEEAKN